MQPESVPIKTLLLRIFVPAVAVVSMLLATFVYSWLYGTIIEGFDRKLVTTSSLAGALIDPEDHDRLILSALAQEDPEEVEQSPAYLRNVMPIRRVRSKLDLTYLYSQAVGGSQDITYVLDGSEGDEHSPIGSEDEMSQTTMAGLRNTEAGGAVFVSPIEYQEQWGLLKTAAAPVYGGDGQITSTVGADVDISVIQIATQNALFASALIGIGSILACLLVALVIVRKVALPIEALKDDALRIAAGDGHSPPQARAPREVIGLRDALAKLAGKMEAAGASREAATTRHEHDADARLLKEQAAPGAGNAIKLADHDGARIYWVCGDDPGIETALASRSMARLAEKLQQETSLVRHWRELADTKRGGCIAVDDQKNQIELIGNAKITITRDGREHSLAAGVPAAFDAQSDVLQLGEDQVLRLAKGDGR